MLSENPWDPVLHLKLGTHQDDFRGQNIPFRDPVCIWGLKLESNIPLAVPYINSKAISRSKNVTTLPNTRKGREIDSTAFK